MDTPLHAFSGLRHGKEIALSAVESFSHGDGYEVLPAKGNLPALYLSVTASKQVVRVTAIGSATS